jgi:Flp pilus assembly protein TadD
VAALRYREALKLKPDLLEAHQDLGGLLCLQGSHEAAEREFQAILEKAPRHRPALKSLALVQATRRNYRSAQQTLQKLLLLDSEDAEAWLHFGDVTMFMGDRQGAREAWVRAASLENASAEVKERAAKRLAIYKAQPLVSQDRPA